MDLIGNCVRSMRQFKTESSVDNASNPLRNTAEIWKSVYLSLMYQHMSKIGVKLAGINVGKVICTYCSLDES